MSKFIRRGLLAFVAVVMMAGVVAQASAVQDNKSNGAANGFRISPVRTELEIEKGQSKTVKIIIENPTNTPTLARPIINNFVASNDESGTPKVIIDDNAEKPRNAFTDLVPGGIPDVQIGAKERKEIEVKISVPKAAYTGGYYGAVRFVAVNEDGGSNVGLTASVGSIFLITVPGEFTQKATVVQLSAVQNEKAKSFMTSGSISVLARLRNDGDIHIKPFGRVSVKNLFGKEVAGFEFNNTEPRGNILPGSTRKFVNDLPKMNWIGRYTITANLAYGQGSSSVQAKTTFWYIPIWMIWVLAGVGVALILGACLLAYKFIKRHKKANPGQGLAQ